MKITDVSKLRGPLGELHDQLLGENGEERLAELKLWLKRVTSVLKRITTVQLRGRKHFVARVAFGEDNPAGIKFFLNEDFKNNFLDKVEKNIPATELSVDILTKQSKDEVIRRELTSEREETFLAYLYELVSHQPNGEDGPFPIDGKANIFYIRDAKDELWAVISGWYSCGRGWDVNACSVTSPDGWVVGYRVFSQVSPRS
ncbi:MAG: hypothetical protein WED06_00400 [Candidatus Paceibacterota bacterium]